MSKSFLIIFFSNLKFVRFSQNLERNVTQRLVNSSGKIKTGGLGLPGQRSIYKNVASYARIGTAKYVGRSGAAGEKLNISNR
jgi:hypothetical protein